MDARDKLSLPLKKKNVRCAFAHAHLNDKDNNTMTGPETGEQDLPRIKDAASIKMRLEEEIVSLITETQGMTLWSNSRFQRL